MSTQSPRVLSDTLEPDLQITLPRERLRSTVHHGALTLLAGGFGILVLLIFITGLGVVSRATLLFREVSTINTRFQQLSLDLERLRSDVVSGGKLCPESIVRCGFRPDRGQENSISEIALHRGNKTEGYFGECGSRTTTRI